MYKRDKMLREEAEKRLQAIREFTELGAGIKIAMRDLEIRGAGNVLGAEQHGQMEAVGYDLYCKLLNTAIRTLKGETEKTEAFETSLDCDDMDAYIPDSYIPNESQKLDIYKKISGIENGEDYLDIQDELVDRFGDIPAPAANLLNVARLKALAHEAYVTELSVKKDGFTMVMYPQAEIRSEEIPDLIVKERGQLRFIRGKDPRFVFQSRERHADCGAMLKKAEELIGKLRLTNV